MSAKSVLSEKSLNYAAIVAGVLTILIALVMMTIFPKDVELPEGYKSPIIAFEFANTEADIPYLMGNLPENITHRDNMRAGHKWDMVFPFVYGGFLFLLLLKLLRQGSKFAAIGLPFALAIIPFDILENLKLLTIVDAAEVTTFSPEMFAELRLATWLKWGCIGMSFTVIGYVQAVTMRMWRSVFACVAGLSSLICFLSGTQPVLAELMAASISISLFVYFVFEVINVFKRE